MIPSGIRNVMELLLEDASPSWHSWFPYAAGSVPYPPQEIADGLVELIGLVRGIDEQEVFGAVVRVAMKYPRPAVRQWAVATLRAIVPLVCSATHPECFITSAWREAAVDCPCWIDGLLSEMRSGGNATRSWIPSWDDCMTPLLVAAEHDPDPDVRLQAVGAWAELEAGYDPTRSSPYTRIFSGTNAWYWRLRERGDPPYTQDDLLLPLLLRVVHEHPSETARVWAVRAIGAQCTPACVSALTDLLAERHELRVRAEAAFALHYFGSTAEDALPELVRLLEVEGDPRDGWKVRHARWCATWGVAQFKHRANTAVRRLAEIVRDDEPMLSAYAIMALWSINPAHLEGVLACAEAADELPHRRGSEWAEVAKNARHTFQFLPADVQANAILPLLQSIRKAYGNDWTLRDVLASLAARGPDAAAALPLLYRNKVDIPEVADVIAAIDVGGQPGAIRLKMAALPLMFHPETDAREILEALYRDRWLLNELATSACAGTRIGPDRAEELAQEFLGSPRLLQQLAKDRTLKFDLRRHRTFVAFLKQAFVRWAINEWKRMERRHLVRRSTIDDLDLLPASGQNPRPGDAAEMEERIRAFVHSRLPDRQRRIIECQLKGLSRAQAAALLEITLATYDKDLTKARKAINRYLVDHDLL